MKMGSKYKRAIFEENIQQGLVEWAQKAKLRKGGLKKSAKGPTQVGPKEDSAAAVQLAQVVKDQPDPPTAAGEIHLATG